MVFNIVCPQVTTENTTNTHIMWIKNMLLFC